MKIELSKEELRQLIVLTMLGANIETTVLEMHGQPFSLAYALEDKLLALAADEGLSAMAERTADGRPVPSRRLAGEIERVMREYDDDTFWFKLETELGLRDFYETLDFKEMRAIKEGDEPMPESVHEFYEKYADEFEQYGADRLRIVSKSTKHDH